MTGLNCQAHGIFLCCERNFIAEHIIVDLNENEKVTKIKIKLVEALSLLKVKIKQCTRNLTTLET